MNAGPPAPAAMAAGTPALRRTWPSAWRRLTQFNLLLLGVQAAALSAWLWPQWRQNPDLAHGLFMPLIFVGLLWDTRRHPPRRHLCGGVLSLGATAAMGSAAVVALVLAGLFAVSLGWSHSLVLFMLTAAFALIWLTALLALAQEPLAVWPFNWATVSVAVLWILAAPLPPGTYTHLTLRLQSWVTAHVLTALQVLGVAARQRGNLIELASTTVGVEEACSGIRSLISCVFTGFFFAALWVRRPWARVLLVGAAAPLAIGMNFLRSLLLTLLANRGVPIAGFWHDATGYGILAVTAVVLAVLALVLEPARARAGTDSRPAAAVAARSPGRAVFASQVALAGALALTSAIAVFFVIHTRPAADRGRPPPELAAVLPASASDWTVTTSDELGRFADVLHTHRMTQRSYFKREGGSLVQITVFLAYWAPGQTTVSNVAVHTPDACWPGVGWQEVPTAATTVAPVLGGRVLPPTEHRLFTSGDYPQHVWYWQLYDGAPILHRDPRSPRELLAIAWHYGFRKDGDQMFVRVSSNQPWSVIATEPLLVEIFAHLRPFGL